MGIKSEMLKASLKALRGREMERGIPLPADYGV